jgi:hypothetical protein
MKAKSSRILAFSQMSRDLYRHITRHPPPLFDLEIVPTVPKLAPKLPSSIFEPLPTPRLNRVYNQSTLRGRILVLENKNAEMLTKMKVTEESAAKEKLDVIRIHPADLENHRQESRLRQECLDADGE